MTKENKVSIKLEVVRDKSSGDLTIVAHFDSKAPNVRVDKNEYIWMPTVDERDLINEAFNFLPTKTTSAPSKPKETKIEEPLPEKIPAEEPLPEKIPAEEPLPETIPPKEPTPEIEKPEELPPLEKEEPAIFEVADEAIPSDDLEKEPKKEEPKKEEPMDAKVDVKPGEPAAEEEKSEEKKEGDEEEGIIVEADAAAIEAALKKHTGKDDKDTTLVEADEQTIVDKVLSQKKKGRWSRK
jgi:hypothetical protein